MYCPKCGCEYREGYYVCADCNVNLVLEKPIIEKSDLYAGFFKRFLAFVTDIIILFVIISPILYLFIFNVVIKLEDNIYGPLFVWFFSLLIELIPAWLYFAIFESSNYKATLGKRLLKIIVVDSNGKKISFERATARTFSKVLSGFCYIGFIMVIFTKKKQALHDLIAQTYVVNSIKEKELVNLEVIS